MKLIIYTQLKVLNFVYNTLLIDTNSLLINSCRLVFSAFVPAAWGMLLLCDFFHRDIL